MNVKNIAFRTDATRQIGSGHFMRCLTLANQLKNQGCQTRFISRNLPEVYQSMLQARGHEFFAIDMYDTDSTLDEVAHAHWLGCSQASDADATRRVLSDRTWDWLIVDHYALDIRWECLLRSQVKKIMVIDDIADRQHDCDVLLDQNFYADMETRYLGKVPTHCQLLLGPHHALLRDEFRRLHEEVKPRTGPLKRILIFFGGVDADNYTSRAIETLFAIGLTGLHVDVVIGAQHPNYVQIKTACSRYRYTCHVQTDKMAELMADADLAIGAGGSVAWERCCLALPTIVFVVARNQEHASRALANRGAVYLGRNEMFVAEIERAMRHFLVPANLHEMSVNAADLVDGQGTKRLCDILLGWTWQ
jgi:UDP-2,4-diacetamido-2,4,6-trideoxy-beta-L-altropyranose hydrolase